MSVETVVYGRVTMDAFMQAFMDAREASPMIADATTAPGTPEQSGTRYILHDDGRSGFAIRPDGELVYVWSLVRRRGDELVQHAILAGATYLDCFDGHLTKLYARHGFVETRREPNWSPDGPDVVYMTAGSPAN